MLSLRPTRRTTSTLQLVSCPCESEASLARASPKLILYALSKFQNEYTLPILVSVSPDSPEIWYSADNVSSDDNIIEDMSESTEIIYGVGIDHNIAPVCDWT